MWDKVGDFEWLSERSTFGSTIWRIRLESCVVALEFYLIKTLYWKPSTRSGPCGGPCVGPCGGCERNGGVKDKRIVSRVIQVVITLNDMMKEFLKVKEALKENVKNLKCVWKMKSLYWI
ncbi:hypothetical protein LR48_Vigan347s002400 [Vigna angularis]|uniref:Uncharacterized protein n=1 Tax=Phaseolus angularis TaxID=3914 RepID=A0A0L9T8P4_PHAAN|nr:hypothetical protein LR48_Vigan347s002400 [Vigna angularis]